ncbi:MAG: hypothetical protein K5873_08600, partial [Treponema sp.]|nr:hypothetical protein [Treponema sp.]
MKGIKNIFRITSAGLALLLAFSACSDIDQKSSEKKDKVSLTGNISLSSALPSALLSKSSSGRSAVSSFATDLDFTVEAAFSGESEEEVSPCSGKVDKDSMTWSVDVGKAGSWNVSISLLSDSTVIMKGESITFEVESLESEAIKTTDAITLYPISSSEVTGNIALDFYSALESVSSLKYKFYTESDEKYESDTVNFSEGKASIKIEGFPAGVYKLSLFFLSNDGSTLYSCNEAVTVFSGFTTDSWYGDSD